MRKMLMKMLIVVTLLLVVAVPVMASTAGQDITGIQEIDEALAAAGLGVLIMLIVELAKRAGAIPDGEAGRVAAVLGIVGYVIMIILQQFQIDVTGEQGQLIVQLLTEVTKLAITVLAALKSYGILRDGEILKPLPGRE